MNATTPSEGRTYIFHGYHLTETLRLKDLERLFEGQAAAQSANRLVYREAEDRYFFVYRFGAVIFFNVTPERRQEVIERIKRIMGYGPDLLTSEDFAVEVRSGEPCSVRFERAIIDRLTLERIDILALVLAQSVALEHFEINVDQMIRESAGIGKALRKHGRMARSTRDIKKFIGKCIVTKQELVASLYLLDKPDETWNDQVLDSLYHGGYGMFELRERYKTIDYKLRMVQENLELISDLLQHRTANALEWAIIILILIEIPLFVFDLFFRH
ncbi:MAG: RMD1 family protein [Proteobacteria bacterium]|nr:RMD1 family protein [Pseudomonadota bacterium]